MGPRKSTRGSAIAEKPRDALCQLKSCHLLRNYTTIEKSHLKGLRIQDHSRSSEMTLFDRSYICSYCWSVVTTSLSPFPRYYHFYSVRGCLWSWEVLQFQFRYDGWNYRSEVTYAFRFVFKDIILVTFLGVWEWKSFKQLKWPSWSLKVIGVGTIQYATYNFILVLYCNNVSLSVYLCIVSEILSLIYQNLEATCSWTHHFQG